MEPEKITCRPTQGLGLCAPGSEKAVPVLDRLTPVTMFNMVGAAAIEEIEDVMQGLGELGSVLSVLSVIR